MNDVTPEDIGKLIIRLALGILILFHGVDKLTNGIGSIESMVTGAGLPAFLAWGAYLGEVVGPLLLIFGFYSRIGATLIAVNMLFAIGLAHAGEIFQLTDHGGWALELQGMFLFTAIGLTLTGAGRIAFRTRYN